MKIKLDENIHVDARQARAALGHDVATVREQRLAGRPDVAIALAVKAEGRCLVTFDLDFADPRRFPPAEFPGLVVMRLRAPTSRHQVERLSRFFAARPEVARRLWILEDTRARDWTP